MPVQIPLPVGKARFDLRVDLDGSTYVMEFDWNSRSDSWSFNILDASGTPLLSGQALRLGSLRLGSRGRSSGLPSGDLLLVDLAGDKTDPGIDGLGDRYALLYYTETELSEVGL